MMQRVVAPALFCEVRNADFTLFYKIGPKTGFRKFLADAGAFGVRQKQLYTCAHRLIHAHGQRHSMWDVLYIYINKYI